MILENFCITKDFGAIEISGAYVDLHNNFDFVGLEFDSLNRVLYLNWKSGRGSWVPENSSSNIQLIFRDVYLLKMKERDPELPYSEDNCLSTLGFIGNDLINEIEGFSDSRPSENANHLNISFMSGFAIKVGSKSAYCLRNEKGNK